MSHGCYPLDELVAIAERPRGDARREHLEACPRCRAALRAYRDFMGGSGDLPAEAQAGPSGARLQEILEGEILGARPETRKGGARRARDAGASAGVRLRGWLTRLATPGRRPAWAAVGVVAVVALVLVPRVLLRPAERAAVLRGPATEAETSLSAEAKVLERGGMRFAWSASAATDGYEVRFYAADLHEVARRTSLPGTSLDLSAEDLARIPSPRLWQVVGLQGEEEVARSPLLELPRVGLSGGRER